MSRTIRRLLRSPRTRRGLAASVVVLSLGGLVLARTPASASAPPHQTQLDPTGRNGIRFQGPGAHGSLSLSHGKVLLGNEQRVLAELRLRANQLDDGVLSRAPLSLVVMLDTSGSMDGDKLAQAKRSVVSLIRKMRSDDEIALVSYDSSARLLQPMTRVADVRERLVSTVYELDADGGTNIPAAIRAGLSATDSAGSGRVKRLVLVSDGLDDTRLEAERLARDGTDRAVTISALGIGLDFDESYLSGVANAGRGNFGFVESPATLARFLERELKETAGTTVSAAVAKLRLPPQLKLVRAVGADVHQDPDGLLELRLGALHSGDERRVVLELRANASAAGEAISIAGRIGWTPTGKARTDLTLTPLLIHGSDSPQKVAEGRDHAVWASCISALSSLRQLEAASAFGRGDRARARKLINDNLADLKSAAADAPAPVAKKLRKQSKTYRHTRDQFSSEAPGSAAGRSAAKKATEADNANLSRPSY